MYEYSKVCLSHNCNSKGFSSSNVGSTSEDKSSYVILDKTVKATLKPDIH